MDRSRRLCAIFSGQDWADASIDHIVIPDSVDIEQARTDWNSWYLQEYCPALKAGEKVVYMDFVEWLINQHDGRHATDDDLTIIHDDHQQPFHRRPGEGPFCAECWDESICGFCGNSGADKIPHPVRWPGEESAGTEYVHALCEQEECARAHAALSDRQRESFLRTV